MTPETARKKAREIAHDNTRNCGWQKWSNRLSHNYICDDLTTAIASALLATWNEAVEISAECAAGWDFGGIIEKDIRALRVDVP